MTTIEIEELYDIAFDMLNLQVPDEFEFCRTVVFDDGVYVDFDVNHRPVAVEILCPSKKLKVLPRKVDVAKLDIAIDISKSSIRLRIDASFDARVNEPRFLEFVVENEFGLPVSDFTFEVVEKRL